MSHTKSAHGHETQDRALSSADFAELAREVAEAWLAELPADESAGGRSSELLEAYRTLAGAVLTAGLPGPDEATDSGTSETGALDRALGTVAAANRRDGRSISQALDDFASLVPTAADRLIERTGLSGEAAEVMRTSARTGRVLDVAMRRLVRLLESGAARLLREQSHNLAAMTDVLSHELENRLGAARTASDMLLSPHIEIDRERLERIARLVQSSVDDALRTVDDVRALATSWAAPAGPPTRTMDLPQLLRTVVSELQSTALDAGVRVEVGTVVDCRVDAPRIRLILFNLIGNGIKYHDGAKDDPRVRIDAEEEADGRVRITVEDNGIGIQPDELEDVFRYRTRGSSTEEVPGSGLGLAIVKEAVEQIGGEISVRSAPGEGTTFTLVFEPAPQAT